VAGERQRKREKKQKKGSNIERGRQEIKNRKRCRENIRKDKSTI
jgi:hypothetical protein